MATVNPELTQSLRAAEQAFAASMANRDLSAFASFLSPETIFFNGDAEIRGKEAVLQAWSRFFEGPDAPFSWEPATVAVLDSGMLGLSSGPVLSPEGERVGTFNSIWRRESDGAWKIVFDKGCP